MIKAIHIISFDIPYPANYGGVIDVYNKLRAFKDLGIQVHLHCFQYGKPEHTWLNDLAEKVFYYPRKMGIARHFNLRPFIVESRCSNDLLENLIENDWPIWMEGLHSSFYLDHPRLSDRIKLVRCHNIESDYYAALANASSFGLKKLYYTIESWKLKREEQKLANANALFAISLKDKNFFKKINKNVYLLNASIYSDEKDKEESLSKTALYHGNLAVEENQLAVKFLIEVFSELKTKLMVAGKEAPTALKRQVNKIENIQLIENPSEDELSALIKISRIHCLPSFQSTGIKLKLIRSLMEGNTVIANNQMLEGSDLSEYCIVANTKQEWQQAIEKAMTLNLDRNAIQKRQSIIREKFNAKANLKLAMEWLDGVL